MAGSWSFRVVDDGVEADLCIFRVIRSGGYMVFSYLCIAITDDDYDEI